ncbi:MAG: hypothetical protein LBF93_06300, partial [Zoogloeaceae bacterium]|nr:hypothetical protein [Zoogloeaceae bacterium]
LATTPVPKGEAGSPSLDQSAVSFIAASVCFWDDDYRIGGKVRQTDRSCRSPELAVYKTLPKYPLENFVGNPHFLPHLF